MNKDQIIGRLEERLKDEKEKFEKEINLANRKVEELLIREGIEGSGSLVQQLLEGIRQSINYNGDELTFVFFVPLNRKGYFP